MHHAELVPAIAEVMLDADDRLWIKHYDPPTDNALRLSPFPPDDGRWTIIREDGSVVAEVELPGPFTPLDARGRSVAGVRQDELGRGAGGRPGAAGVATSGTTHVSHPAMALDRNSCVLSGRRRARHPPPPPSYRSIS